MIVKRCNRTEIKTQTDWQSVLQNAGKKTTNHEVVIRFRIVTAFSLVCICSAQPCWAGSKVTVGSKVPENRRVSMDNLDHSVWNALLHRYVDTRGNVDYSGWKQNSADVRALDGYLNTLSTGEPRARARTSGKLAFWINAYNAVTIKGILREYPTSSIRNHTARVFGYNIWKDLLLIVGGSSHSLEDIENEILRKMGEPRIHFAIVCASRSCARLLNEAFTAQKLERQLDSDTRNFFANDENFRYDARTGTFYLSSILSWYATDFGSNQAAQLRTISQYLPDRTSQLAAANGSGRVRYLDYDWSLNDQKTARNAGR